MSEYEFVLMNRRSNDELVCMDSDDFFSYEPAEVIATLQECFLSGPLIRDRYCHLVIWKDAIWSLQLYEARDGKMTGKKLYECEFTDHTQNMELTHTSFTNLLAFLVERYWNMCDLGFYYVTRPLGEDLVVNVPLLEDRDSISKEEGKKRRFDQ